MILEQQPIEPFRGGTETLQRLAEMDRVLDLTRELSIYNLILTSVIILICVWKAISILRNSQRLQHLEKLVGENVSRAQGFYQVGQRVMDNQDYFRNGLDRAMDMLYKLIHSDNRTTSNKNRGTNNVKINNGSDPKTPADFQSALYTHLNNSKTQLEYELQFERRRVAILEKRLKEQEKENRDEPAPNSTKD